MKKIFILLTLSFFLVSCFGNKTEEVKEEIKTTGSSVEEAEKEAKISFKGIEITSSEEKIDIQRNEVSLDDLDLVLKNDKKPKNQILEIGKKFVEVLESTKEFEITKNVNGGIKFEDFEEKVKELPKEIQRNFDLELNISDFQTGKNISEGIVFVNGIRFGEFKDGNFRKEFFWQKGIEKFDIMVRSKGYGDSFLSLNSINGKGSYLVSNVKMKKLNLEKKVSLAKEVKLEDKNVSIKIPECSLVDSKGMCYKGNVETKINFISGEDVNTGRVSLNMKALTKEGQIVELQSGGMAFTDFIAENGEILSVGKGKKVEITYKVDEQTISEMENTLYGQGEKNGYWLYDKNKNIWLEKEAEIKLDKKNKTWTAIVSEIY